MVWSYKYSYTYSSTTAIRVAFLISKFFFSLQLSMNGFYTAYWRITQLIYVPRHWHWTWKREEISLEYKDTRTVVWRYSYGVQDNVQKNNIRSSSHHLPLGVQTTFRTTRVLAKSRNRPMCSTGGRPLKCWIDENLEVFQVSGIRLGVQSVISERFTMVSERPNEIIEHPRENDQVLRVLFPSVTQL